MRSSSPASWPPGRVTPRSWSPRTGRWRHRRPARSTRRSRSCRSAAIARTRRSSRLSVRTSPSAVTRSVFISIANLDLEYAQRRIELRGDGGLIEARDVALDPQARADVVIDDVPADVGTLEVRLVGSDPAVTAAPDDLAIDDRAWAVVPPDQRRLVLLVGEGDPYLETALSYLPERRAVRGDPGRLRPGRPSGRTAGRGTSSSSRPRCPRRSRHADPGHRAAELEPAGRGRRARSRTRASGR